MSITVLPAFTLRLSKRICPVTTTPDLPGENPSDIWFPAPGTIVDLPTAPPPDTNPEVIPGNSSPVDACFDPNNPDLDQIFNNILPPEDEDGVPDQGLDTGDLIPADNIIIPIVAAVRCFFRIRDYNYALSNVVTDVTFTTKLLSTVFDVVAALNAETAAVALSGSDVSFVKGSAFGPGQFVLSGADADYTYSYPATRTLTGAAGSYALNASRRNLVLSHFDTDLSEEIGLVPGWGTYRQDTNYGPIISSAEAKFGAGSVNFNTDNQTHLYAYLPWSELSSYDGNFFMEAFFYPTSEDLLYTILGLGDQTGSDGYLVYYYSESIYVYQVAAGSNFGVDVFEAPVGALANQWSHLALEQTDDGLRVYVNGQHRDNLVGATPYVPATRLDLRNAIFVGGYGNTPGSTLWTPSRGYIDEYRLSEGALYNGSDFNVPTEAYPTIPPTGGSAILSFQQNLVAGSGSFNLTGQDAGSLLAQVLPAAGGTFITAGQAAGFSRPSLRFPVQSGAFSLSGKPLIEVKYVNSLTFSGTSEQVVNWPAGAGIGDIGILLIESSAATANYGPVYPPFGWTRLPGIPIKNVTNLAAPSYLNAFYRVISDLDQAIEVTLPSNHYAAVLAVYSGVDTQDPVVTSGLAEPGSGSALSFPALTGIIPRTTVLNMAVGGTDNATSPTLSSVANASSYWSAAGTVNAVATSAADGGFAIIYQGKTRSLNDGLAVTTATSNKTTHLLMTLALRPKGWVTPSEDLIGEAGSFALAGQVVGFLRAYVFPAFAGAFSLAGQAAGFIYGKILAGSSGGVALVGQGADFTYSRRVAGAAGSIVLAGQNADLIGPGFTGEVGSFSLSGQPATLKRVLVAGAGSTALSGQAANLLDPNATAYVAAVETADAQDLEFGVVTAIDTFIKGCKSDGIWNAIKASCIMAGARTLAGALTPLKGTAPTNFNFVAGDYNRKTGLVGNGSTKYLNTNRAVTADPQNNCHISAYVTSVTTGSAVSLGSPGLTNTGASVLAHVNPIQGRLRCTTYKTGTINAAPPSFAGFSRSSSLDFVARSNGSSETITQSSAAYTFSDSYTLHRFQNFYYSSRITFYSIGESLNLALLDSRVTTLMADIAAAIP